MAQPGPPIWYRSVARCPTESRHSTDRLPGAIPTPAPARSDRSLSRPVPDRIPTRYRPVPRCDPRHRYRPNRFSRCRHVPAKPATARTGPLGSWRDPGQGNETVRITTPPGSAVRTGGFRYYDVIVGCDTGESRQNRQPVQIR